MTRQKSSKFLESQKLIAYESVRRWLSKETIKSSKTRKTYLYHLQLLADRIGLNPDESVARRIEDMAEREFATTLDGAAKYGRPTTLTDIKQIGRLDLVVAGASAVNLEGVRYGKGHGYFDLEWGMLSEVGAIGENTPLLTVVHDCQVLDQKLPVSPYDTITDYIITPTRIIKVETRRTKPKGIHWKRLQKGMLKQIPPLAELKQIGQRGA